MKKLHRFLALALVLALAAGLVPAASAEAPKTVNVAVTGSIGSLNPIAMDNTEVVKYATSLVFLPLVELNADLEFVPQLAESITTEDNLTFTIRLRDDAVWSDGAPVTAKDVEFTLVVSASPESYNISLATYAIVGVSDEGTIESGASSIEGVKIIDDKTLTVSTKYPMALYTFENNFGRYLLPVPEHVLRDVPRGEILTHPWFNKPDVISGPYAIVDFDLDHYVHYIANDKYFLGAPKIQYLNINVVAPSQLLAGLQSGEIDVVQQTMGSIPLDDYDAVKALPNVTAVQGTPITNESIFINTAKVTDVRIRQALLYGMDRQTVLTELAHSNGELVDGFLCSASPYYSAELGLTPYDPDKAAQLIAEAKADGASTDLVWYVNASESTWGQAVEYFAAMFAEIGLNITIRTVDLAQLMTVANEGEHDIMSVEYTYAPVDPYTDVAWLLGGEGSWTGYASEETDTALALSQELTDDEAITAQYLVVDRAMQTDVAMISGYILSTLGAKSNHLLNANVDVFGTFINVHEWDVE